MLYESRQTRQTCWLKKSEVYPFDVFGTDDTLLSTDYPVQKLIKSFAGYGCKKNWWYFVGDLCALRMFFF